MGHFSAISDLLNGRFTPQEAGSAGKAKSNKKVTLHDALKLKLGTTPDWAVIAYTNATDLHRAIDLTYLILTDVVGSRADVWATQSARSEAEVIDALAAAEAHGSASDPVLNVLGVERPSIGRIPGVGKYRASIAATASAIAEVSGRQFGAVLADALDGADDETDSSLLAAVDRQTTTLPAELNDPLLASYFSKAASLWFESSNTWKVSVYCRMLAVDLRSIEDTQLIRHLSDSG